MWTLLAILIAFALDWFFGDPPKIPHLVVYIGKLISWLEKQLRPLFSATAKDERTAGGLLVIIVCAVSFFATLAVCLVAGAIHPVVRLVVETFVHTPRLCGALWSVSSLVSELKPFCRIGALDL